MADSATILIRGDPAELKKALDESQSMVKSWGERAKDALTIAIGVAGGGMVGNLLTKAFTTVKDSILALPKALNDLNNRLDDATGATKKYSDALEGVMTRVQTRLINVLGKTRDSLDPLIMLIEKLGDIAEVTIQYFANMLKPISDVVSGFNLATIAIHNAMTMLQSLTINLLATIGTVMRRIGDLFEAFKLQLDLAIRGLAQVIRDKFYGMFGMKGPAQTPAEAKLIQEMGVQLGVLMLGLGRVFQEEKEKVAKLFGELKPLPNLPGMAGAGDRAPQAVFESLEGIWKRIGAPRVAPEDKIIENQNKNAAQADKRQQQMADHWANLFIQIAKFGAPNLTNWAQLERLEKLLRGVGRWPLPGMENFPAAGGP
jgi:hypothetical protein